MLETLAELIAETQNRLAVSTAATFFTPTKISDTIKNSYMWAASVYQWPQLEKAKKTAKKADQYYYDYPPSMMSDSITRLIVDGDLYEQKDFDDFLNYKHQTTGTKDLKIFADYNRQYFIYPTPTADDTGDDKSIIVFGLEEPAALANPGDKTIFNGSESAANEAIVKKALSVLLPQADKKKEGQVEEQEAIQLLANVYSKIMARQGKKQRLNKPQFDVPDFFGANNCKNNIGNFDL